MAPPDGAEYANDPRWKPRAGGGRGPGAEDPECADFDAFAGKYPALLDKRLLSRHYRSSTLASAPARAGWVEPDLLPLPRL